MQAVAFVDEIRDHPQDGMCWLRLDCSDEVNTVFMIEMEISEYEVDDLKLEESDEVPIRVSWEPLDESFPAEIYFDPIEETDEDGQVFVQFYRH
jgi:hypothetical protein